MEFILKQYKLPLQGEKISDLHGKPLTVDTGEREVTVIPLYHPAVALYNRNQRKTLEEDFQILRRHIWTSARSRHLARLSHATLARRAKLGCGRTQTETLNKLIDPRIRRGVDLQLNTPGGKNDGASLPGIGTQ